MIIAPYKSRYFQLNPMALKIAVDDSTCNIDEEKISYIPDKKDEDIKEVYFTVLISACLIDNEELVEYILDKGANVNIGVDYYGNSCAHIAIQFGNLNILRKLITHGADLEDRRSWQKITLLHASVFRKNYAIAKYLINLGANVNAISHYKTYLEYLPLVTAVELELTDIVELLLDNGAKNVCPVKAGRFPRKHRLISPLEYFVPYTQILNGDIFKQCALTTLFGHIELYYFQKILDIAFQRENIQIILNNLPGIGGDNLDDRLSNYQTSIQYHVAKIFSFNDDYCENSHKSWDLIRAECDKEINIMKTVSLPGTSLLWYDVLSMTPCELAKTLNENSIYYDLDELEQVFPLYGGIFYYQYLLGYRQIGLNNANIMQCDALMAKL